jgi:hypothetical protein
MKRALSKDRALFIVQIRRFGLNRFRLVGAAALFTSGERRRATGEKASPLAIPGSG